MQSENYGNRFTNSSKQNTISIKQFTNSVKQVINSNKQITNCVTQVTNSGKQVAISGKQVTNSVTQVTNSGKQVANSSEQVTNSSELVANSTEQVTNSRKQITNSGEQYTNISMRVTNSNKYQKNILKHVSNRNKALKNRACGALIIKSCFELKKTLINFYAAERRKRKMVKYMESVISRLKSLKSGMESNSSLWTGLQETPAALKARIDELIAIEKEMNDAQTKWIVMISESHTLSDSADKYADKIEALATGLHNETPQKLSEYNLAQRKARSAVPKPTKVIIPVLEDDTDGMGFVVSTQLDTDATNYHWFKGVSSDPKNVNAIPEMHPFKITSKTSFVDDDVEKGVRYFYKVQAFNSHGTGTMSEAVSRIQQ